MSRRTENGEATPSKEKERKKKEKLEKELKKKRRFSVIIGRRTTGYNGARVANASGTPGCRLRHARLLPRGVSCKRGCLRNSGNVVSEQG